MIDRRVRGLVVVVIAAALGVVARADVLCCPGDLSGDGAVGPADLSILLGAWGGSGPGDLDGSGAVDSADLSLLLNGWGLCAGEWVATYGGMPGADGVVYDAIWFDDGSGAGPRLHVAGDFSSVGGAPARGVARWTGERWEPIGAFEATVFKLVSFDDGSGAGPSLYGVLGLEIWKWTGTGWALIGSANGIIDALAAHDDGNGPALFVGGAFTQIGGVPANRIARFDGSSWSALGGGFNSSVLALAVYDDGEGERLYAGGSFASSGLLPLWGIAAWDGAAWSSVFGGVNGTVRALEVFDDGSGPALFVGGDFLQVFAVGPTQRLARWDGAWTAFPIGCDGSVRALSGVVDEKGPALWIGGAFTNAGGNVSPGLASWDGFAWTPLTEPDRGPNGEVFAIVESERSTPGVGGATVIGAFRKIDGEAVLRIATRIDGAWLPIAPGVIPPLELPNESPAQTATPALDGEVITILRTPVADGAADVGAFVMGGSFTQVGGLAARGVAAWDGEAWSAFGSGLGGWVWALAYAELPGAKGRALYAAGYVSLGDEEPVARVVRWTGSEWLPVGDVFNAGVFALVEFDGGDGPELIAAGGFWSVGTTPISRIARWNGSEWQPLGGGAGSTVYALLVAQLPSDPAPRLYAPGSFLIAEGQLIRGVARWDGAVWSAVGSPQAVQGNSIPVTSIAYLDESLGGPGLAIGGSFHMIDDGILMRGVARFDGSHWRPLASENSWEFILALDVVRRGDRSELVLGGVEYAPGGWQWRVGRWDGTWLAPYEGDFLGFIRAIRAVGGAEPRVLIGGSFGVSPAGDSFLTTRGCGESK